MNEATPDPFHTLRAEETKTESDFLLNARWIWHEDGADQGLAIRHDGGYQKSFNARNNLATVLAHFGQLEELSRPPNKT